MIDDVAELASIDGAFFSEGKGVDIKERVNSRLERLNFGEIGSAICITDEFSDFNLIGKIILGVSVLQGLNGTIALRGRT